MRTFDGKNIPEKYYELAGEYKEKYGVTPPGGNDEYAFEEWIEDEVLSKARSSHMIPESEPAGFCGFGMDANHREQGISFIEPSWAWQTGDKTLILRTRLWYDRIFDPLKAKWDDDFLVVKEQ